MKITMVFIFFTVLMAGKIMCQTQPANAFDITGKKTGFWRVQHDNGKVRYEGFFVNDKPVGEFKRYYRSGVIQASMNFSGDGSQAYAILFFENAKPAAEGKYVEKLKDSIWNYYSEHDNHLTMKENYVLGKKQGASIKYYRNDQMSELIHYKDDLRNGLWEQYYENGKIRLRSNYVDDLREGVFQTWNHEGLPSVKGKYRKGVMNGEWIYYNDNGELEISAEYNDGQLIPNDEIEKRKEEFSKRVEESIGKFIEPEIK